MEECNYYERIEKRKEGKSRRNEGRREEVKRVWGEKELVFCGRSVAKRGI